MGNKSNTHKAVALVVCHLAAKVWLPWAFSSVTGRVVTEKI